ncbi:MAG: HNH endonuclease [Chitinophagaceae bacterium]|nr:HNH endonuclease [Chitinophagaceae bacterium]
MKKIDKEYFVSVCKESASMAEAASKLKLHFNTFKKLAIQFKCYNPNQGGKGLHKLKTIGLIPLNEILNGQQPQYQTFKLKNRLIREGIKKNKCENCGISEWDGKSLQMELHHIDGDRTNHKLKNLRILCPNCHSQTETFRAKNI